MLPPYAGKHSYVGIYMQSATHTGQVNNAITIGGASNGTENVFDKLKIGILNFGSNSLIQNNVFQNLRNTTNNSTTNNSFTYGMYGVGVFINNFFGPTTLTNTIGGSLAQKNTFIDDEYGVYNQFGTALNIAFNRFETQDNGIRIGEHSMNKIVNITSNKFINNIRGINLLNNSSVSGITASITANVLENPTAQGTAADNFAIRTTEMSVASASINAGAKYSLYNNYVYGYYNGIYSAFTYSNSIKDNEVHMIQSGGGFQFGITTNRTGESEVANNVVDMQSLNAGAWYQAGYFVDNTMAPHIHCNNVNNLYNGFGVNYLNYCTPGNGFYGNLMQNAVNGFQLNANGEIGNQYYLNTSNSADNAWFNCTTQTSAGSGCNASGAKFYTRPTSPYNITLAGGTGVLLIGTNNSAASTQTCYASITTPTLNLKIGGAFGKALMQDQADEIADGTINFGANDANTKHIARKKLYYHTMLRNIDPNVTPSMANFMNGHRNQAVGKFWIIDSLINTGDSVKWNMAKALNNTVNANNDAEETQQAFNSQYITYLQNKRQLSVIEISSLESMASKCPIEYGDAVVQARTLLFNITYKQYYNTCEFEQPTGTKFKIAQTVADGSNIVLYPNPNDGKFVFESNDDLSYDLEVYNLLGEKILQQTVANKYEINLDNIAFSTYIVRMSRNGEQIKTIRICIIK